MSSPDLTPRAHQILIAARGLLEEAGADALSMRTLAQRLGIRAPSLYKHFPSKEALEAALISEGLGEQGALFAEAVAGDQNPLSAIAGAYRAYARRHPHLYRLMYDRPLNRALLWPGAEETAARPVLQAAGGDHDLARAIWAFGHGMTMLELNGRFPDDADLDAAWNRGLAALRPERSMTEVTTRGSQPPTR